MSSASDFGAATLSSPGAASARWRRRNSVLGARPERARKRGRDTNATNPGLGGKLKYKPGDFQFSLRRPLDALRVSDTYLTHVKMCTFYVDLLADYTHICGTTTWYYPIASSRTSTAAISLPHWNVLLLLRLVI